MNTTWRFNAENLYSGYHVAEMVNESNDSECIVFINKCNEFFYVEFSSKYSLFSDYTISFDEIYPVTSILHAQLSKTAQELKAIELVSWMVESNFKKDIVSFSRITGRQLSFSC